MDYNETPTKGFTMNVKQKLVIIGTVTAVVAPAALVLGQKIGQRVQATRSTKTEAPAETSN